MSYVSSVTQVDIALDTAGSTLHYVDGRCCPVDSPYSSSSDGVLASMGEQSAVDLTGLHYERHSIDPRYNSIDFKAYDHIQPTNV
ncbi:hypothetical protein UY3_02701 [Chelonia mydas]|uniref:Uncharacterized protein n=1 Tax=Chelonia mydas TaxID=8469 RepID=M7BW65_CHEMY|nr:hypothetical protein UY3_02701 [Chelonia mydas]